MLNALSAEALKMRTHKATWFLVWLYPILFTILFLIAITVGLFGGDPPEQSTLADWIDETAMIWNVPGNSVGRYLMAAFVAVVFAGEYGWNTWKLIVPHRARAALIASKYVLVLILFTVTFILTGLISIIGTWADDTLTGDTIPAGITAAGLLRAHWIGYVAALGPILVTMAYASLAAILTRSTIAALVIAIVVTTIEQIVFNLGPVLSINFPAVTHFLYNLLPGYHLGNLDSWLSEGSAYRGEFPSGRVVALPWTTSLGVVAAWIAALVTATFAAFKRQDIN
ncbi:MAG TPA: ABC transporter permease [Allosphingosinicella sp.]|jgi:ABC-type transport system involved in multi-copper enzyme maturation permease subunit